MSSEFFVRVLVPLRLEWIPVYRSSIPLKTGQAVNVLLAGRRYTGIVWESCAVPDIETSRIRPIISAAPEVPDAGEREMKFWKFLSDYYMCSPGEVYKAARPVFYARRAKMSAAAAERIRKRLETTEADLKKKHRSGSVIRRLEEKRDDLLSQLQRSTSTREPSGPFLPTDGKLPKPLAINGQERLERYVPEIREALGRNGQVLILVPESGFCDRLAKALTTAFGDVVRTFTPEMTETLKSRMSEDLRTGSSLVAIGTKTAIFLPFSRLALVIIDEEQDPLYKQNDSAPRYNGRDAAIKLAELHSARVILGSCRPSLETEYNCITGKFEMSSCRIVNAGAEIINIPEEKRKNGMSGYFSRKMAAAITRSKGPVTLIRGWEKPDELASEMATLFNRSDIDVLTLNELKHNGCGETALIAVLQADALVSRDDFRSDERALQIVALLCSLAPHVIIQTSLTERFDGSKTTESLLRERREFNFPPYSRLVEIRKTGSGETIERHFLQRDSSLAVRKSEILASMPDGCYPDVDPA